MNLDCPSGRRLEPVLAAAKKAGFSGINITFPVKQVILPLLDEISADARQPPLAPAPTCASPTYAGLTPTLGRPMKRAGSVVIWPAGLQPRKTTQLKGRARFLHSDCARSIG